MCAPSVDLGDSGGGSAEMGSAAWGKMLGALASAGSGGQLLSNELSGAHTGNEDWIARQKQDEVKLIGDGDKIITVNAADLPPEMLAAYGYGYDPIYGVEPLDYDNPNWGQPGGSQWVRGPNGDFWAPSVTGEVVEGSLVEIHPAAGSLAGSASLLTNHEFDDMRPPRLDERLAEDTGPGVGISVQIPSELKPDPVRDAVVDALLGRITTRVSVLGSNQGMPNAAPGTSTLYSAAQADTEQQSKYDGNVASQGGQADAGSGAIGGSGGESTGASAPSADHAGDGDAGDWRWSVVAATPGDAPGGSGAGGLGNPMDPTMPSAGGEGQGIFAQQGFFNDGRIVPNIFKVINQDLLKAAQKSSGVEYALTYPFVMAMSGALLLPQTINDIPNIPTLIAAALAETDQGNFGKALEAGGDAASALGMLGEIAEGVEALHVADGIDTIRNPGGPQAATYDPNGAPPPPWRVKNLDRNDPRVVVQSHSGSCSAAGVEMVATHAEVENVVNQSSLLSEMRESSGNPRIGIWPRNIQDGELIDAANALESGAESLVADGKSWMADMRELDNLENEINRISADGPWVADMWYPSSPDPTYHSVTVLGLDAAGDVMILDPSGYSYQMALTDFEQIWQDSYIIRR